MSFPCGWPQPRTLIPFEQCSLNLGVGPRNILPQFLHLWILYNLLMQVHSILNVFRISGFMPKSFQEVAWPANYTPWSAWYNFLTSQDFQMLKNADFGWLTLYRKLESYLVQPYMFICYIYSPFWLPTLSQRHKLVSLVVSCT